MGPKLVQRVPELSCQIVDTSLRAAGASVSCTGRQQSSLPLVNWAQKALFIHPPACYGHGLFTKCCRERPGRHDAGSHGSCMTRQGSSNLDSRHWLPCICPLHSIALSCHASRHCNSLSTVTLDRLLLPSLLHVVRNRACSLAWARAFLALVP